MEKHLVAEWTYLGLAMSSNDTGKLMGERVYRDGGEGYLVEDWAEGEHSTWGRWSSRRFEETLERREFPFRGPINEPRQPKWCLG